MHLMSNNFTVVLPTVCPVLFTRKGAFNAPVDDDEAVFFETKEMHVKESRIYKYNSHTMYL